MSNPTAARKRLLEKLHFDPCVDWRVILDRVRFGCDRDPSPSLAGVPGLVQGLPKLLKTFPQQRFHPYAQLQYWRDERSDMTVVVESAPTKHWIRYPFRITLNADDGTGVLPPQTFAVLEVVPQSQLLMVEIALDYIGDATRDEIHRRVLIGKARPAQSDAKVLRWGNRQTKLFRLYDKPEIECVRGEFQLGPRFLRKYEIATPYDFHKLATILPSHLSFHRINEQKLADRLSAMRINPKRREAILRFVAKSNEGLCPILQLLRSEGIGMTNVRRLLDQDSMNDEAMNALKAWAAQWPMQPTRLGKTV
jgi:hypothetical protein